MTKFEIGDRLRDRDTGTIRTVTDTNANGTTIKTDDGFACLAASFELYAKAGEFMVGDWVVLDGEGITRRMPPAAAYKIDQICQPATAPYYLVIQGVFIAQDCARLATPEEIAAADLAAPKLGEANPSIVIEPKPFGKFFTILGEPDTRPTEIPAAEFDFSTIKAGDEVTVRLKVHSAGLDQDGEVACLGRPERPDALRYIGPSEIINVIPTPKPKTLRTRVIHAAESVERCADHDVYLARIADAVLAEVEKG